MQTAVNVHDDRIDQCDFFLGAEPAGGIERSSSFL
jgi:hypothetical protein